MSDDPDRPEWAERVIDWLYSGKSLLAFCRVKGNPPRRTIYNLRDRDADYLAQFARAREGQAGSKVDEAGDIAAAATPETVAVAKLQVETCLKQAACYAPHIYGTKIALGGDASAPPIRVDTQSSQPIPSNLDLKAGIDRLKQLSDELLPGDSPP